MESLILSVNTTVPLFILMAIGYFLKSIKLFKGDFLNTLNTLVFKLFLPVMIFNNLRTTDIQNVWDGNCVLYAVGSLFVIFSLLLIIIPRLEKDNKRKSVLVQAIYRSNYAFLGIPIAAELCGNSNAPLATVLLAVCVPVFNALCVVTFEIYRGGKINVKNMLINIIKNPLIIASLLGIIVLLIGVEFPYIIDKPLNDISKSCTPVALIVLGGFLDFKKFKGNLKPICVGVIGRLVIVPLIFVTVAVLFGFRGEALAALFALYATPTAITSFTMAHNMGGDSDLAAQLVIIQSVLSMATIFIGVFILSQFQLL